MANNEAQLTTKREGRREFFKKVGLFAGGFVVGTGGRSLLGTIFPSHTPDQSAPFYVAEPYSISRRGTVRVEKYGLVVEEDGKKPTYIDLRKELEAIGLKKFGAGAKIVSGELEIGKPIEYFVTAPGADGVIRVLIEPNSYSSDVLRREGFSFPQSFSLMPLPYSAVLTLSDKFTVEGVVRPITYEHKELLIFDFRSKSVVRKPLNELLKEMGIKK
ncbi:MAG: hypothetical protein AB1468_02230 [Candidatus Micrarchaeota archaeon]